jgi:hypothetical protein
MNTTSERIEEGDLDAINEAAQSVLDERINLGYMRLLAAICKPVLAIAVLALVPNALFARIGETEAQIEQRVPSCPC